MNSFGSWDGEKKVLYLLHVKVYCEEKYAFYVFKFGMVKSNFFFFFWGKKLHECLVA